jgi:SPP1 family phage portal protein
MIVVKGNVTGFATKGETGKMLQVNGEGSVNTLSWDRSPESVKMEQETLKKEINTNTSTPDISFETMKSIGALSGAALKMLFLDAHLKAADKEETFGKSMQRRVNFLLYALTMINTELSKALTLSVKPQFTYYMPKDEALEVETLTTAFSGGILSKLSAVKQNPLVYDADEEIKQMGKEAEERQKDPQELDNLMNG